MKSFFGVLLIIFGFVAWLYFSNYKGSLISSPAVWTLLAILSGFGGVWLIVSSIKARFKETERYIKTEEENFKMAAAKVEIDADKCEFKSGSFSHEVPDEQIETAKYFLPGTSSWHTPTITEHVNSSYVIFTIDENKYVSQSFPIDKTTLQYYVLSKSLSLYIKRSDPKHYMFFLERNV